MKFLPVLFVPLLLLSCRPAIGESHPHASKAIAAGVEATCSGGSGCNA